MTARLEGRGLSKSYGRRRVLQDVDLTLERGVALGLIGPNGAGKTTLLRVLSGFLRPDAGKVSDVSGILESAMPRRRFAQFGGAHTIPPHVRARSWGILVSLGAWIPGEKRRVRDLSRGTRQMLGLRSTLARPNVDTLLFDEPWEGLDPDGARWLNATLLERVSAGAAVLVSSHRLHDLAAVCDRYAFLRDGSLRVCSREEIGPVVGGDELMREFDKRKDPA
ncbi:MAG: ATP-binding cassette domain-containing protein [Acidobacteriota bacterium]